jgi:hypothetical protein
MAISGQKLRLTYQGRTVDAVVVFGSENKKSLMVEFDALLDGCPGMMAIATEDDGTTRNLLSWHVVEIEWA